MKESSEKKRTPSGKKKTTIIAVVVALAVLLALGIGVTIGLILKNQLGFDPDSPFSEDQFINKIFPNGLWDLVINISAFVLLLLFVFLLGYRPVVKMMKARSDAIEAEMKEAEGHLKEARLAASQKEATIEEGRKEAAAIVENAKKQATSQAEAIVDQAKADAIAIKTKADEDIALAKEKSKQEVREEIVDVALEASSQILAREVNEKDHRRLVDDFLASLEEEKGGRK